MTTVSHEKFQFETFNTDVEEWDYYIQRFNIALDLQGLSENNVTNNNKKKQLLLSRVGPTAFKVLVDYFRPTSVTTKTYDELVNVLNEYYGKKTYVLAERVTFATKQRDENKTISQFVLELRALAGYCEFGNTLEERIRDQLVIGINKINWQQEIIRNHPTNSSKLADVIATAHQLEQAEIQSLRITQSKQQTGNNVVDELNTNKVSTKSNRYKKHRNNKSNKICIFCGNNYHRDLKDCPARGKQCNACGKKNHFSSACLTTGKGKLRKYQTRYVHGNNSRNTESSDSSDNESSHTYRINAHSYANKIMLPTQLNNINVEMLYDPGAVHSVIGKTLWKSIGSPKLKKCNNLIAYTDVTIKTMGICQLAVKAFNKTKMLEVYVTKQDDIPLFGLDWCIQFELPMPPGARICNVKKDVTSSTTNSDLNKQINKFLEEFKTLFDGKLGTIKGHCAKIHISDDVRPKAFRPRPVPLALQDQVTKELERLVNEGVIEPVDTMTTPIEWASPIVVALKANGNVRICSDFKVTINQYVQTDDYPIPRFEEITSKLSGGELFTKIDLKDAYLQLLAHPESRKYLTIATHKGYFQYKRLPFGISFAPAVFQRIMHQILSGLDGVVCYLDDILITAPSTALHISRVKSVLERLSAAGIKSQISKCSWFQESVTFLGHKIDKNGLHPTTERIEAIKSMPIPSNVSELRSFLGSITYYGRFIDRLHVRCAPLYRHLKKGHKWNWSKDDTQIIDELKQILTSTDTLAHYDANLPIILSSDASDKGLGAVLFHKYENNVMTPIAYASRTLSEVEKRYSTIDKEALGIVYAVTKFHQYLYGRKFTLLTDHKPLERIFNKDRETPKVASNRLLRWSMTLNSYDYTIKYHPAKENTPADALSRLPLPNTETTQEERTGLPKFAHLLHLRLKNIPITQKHLKVQTSKDILLGKIKGFISTHWPEKKELSSEFHTYFEKRHEMSFEEGIILWNGRLCIPTTLQNDILEMLHDGHNSINAMQSLARLHVYWPNIDKDIMGFSKKCKYCQQSKRNTNAAPVYPWGVPPEPWYRLHIDFAGPIFGFTWLIVIDAYTKWLEVIPMKTTTSAATIMKLDHIFATFGVPRYIVSDNGPQFISDDFKSYCKMIGVTHIRTTPYHPRTNGLAERAVRTFKERMYAANSSLDVHERLNKFLQAYRNSPRRSTNRSPYEMMFGRMMRTTFDLLKPNVKENLEKARLQQQLKKYSRETFPPEFKPGDSVWVNKTRERGSEPGVITKRSGIYSYNVELNGNVMRKHVEQLRPRTTDYTYYKTTVRPQPEQGDGATTSQPEVQTNHSPGPSGSAPVSQHETQDAAPRRSDRIKKPPARFGFWGSIM